MLDQKGLNNGFVRLEVVPTTVNYSVTPVLFIASHLKMTWSNNSLEESVTLGKDLDQNIVYEVQFTAGSGGTNSTLSLTGLASFSADIPNNILDFTNTGPLFAGSPVSGGGIGFVGCIISGRNIPLVKSHTSINISENCTLDYQLGCPTIGQWNIFVSYTNIESENFSLLSCFLCFFLTKQKQNDFYTRTGSFYLCG